MLFSPSSNTKPKVPFFQVLFILLAVSVVQHAVAQQVDVIRKGSAIEIKSDATIRISGGNIITSIHVPREQIDIVSKIDGGVVLLSIQCKKPVTWSASDFAGIFFDKIPAYKQGVVLWRYKPWNSWSKPIALQGADEMPADDVQFFYWQYEDGLYGAAVPLNGPDCRTTLGSENHNWGSKATTSAATKMQQEIPAMAIAFGKNPFEVFERIYRVALTAMGRSGNLQKNKKFPEPLNYFGWCSWNSSDNGKNLNEKLVIDAVRSFTEHGFPLGWVLIDDGWFQHKNQQLQSFLPDPAKFPNGFKPMIKTLKQDYHIRYAGIWHAFDGYWNGIDPASPLGDRYRNELFYWDQKSNDQTNRYYFIKPTSDSLKTFYENWHRFFREQGIDFVKIDNQLVAERMAVNNYPVFQLSDSMHRAIYRSVNKYFHGVLINCMDMTADAYFNFGSSAVARGVEDYFPYEQHETYNLQQGNAAAHVLQAIYNDIYFSQMVFSDFDEFESDNPNAEFHAIARAIHNGPIYVTDKPGNQNFDILNKLVYSDGRIIRSQTSLLPTADCLFQVQAAWPFKAYSKTGKRGLLGIWNAADTNRVVGAFKTSDIDGLRGGQFALYEHFSGLVSEVSKDQSIPVVLGKLAYALYYAVPIENGFAAFGLTDKYNAPATILGEKRTANRTTLDLYEGGTFKAWSRDKPRHVLVNGKAKDFKFNDKLLVIHVPPGKRPQLQIDW